MFDLQPRHPFEQETVPQSGWRADREVVAVLIGEADLELGMLPHANEGERVLLELLAGGGELGAGLRTLKKRASEHVLEAFDAR